jgi:uncharacterized protein (DUF1015 family)
MHSMVSEVHGAPGGPGPTPPGAGLELVPFRGLRFDPEYVGDLGTVISPPYDVLDADTVRDLEAANRRNIVRLILSRPYERPYLAVRDRLQKWRDGRYLRADTAPALYLYDYAAGHDVVRGLVGLVALRREEERVILPHEDVMPGPVEDRAALMRTTETNLEPILLVHHGTPALRELVTTASTADPTAQFVALDGSRHRLWALTDPATIGAVAAELSAGQALIADGHHRYAAYLRLQQEHRDAEDRAGHHAEDSPWNYGLALLVDQDAGSLRIGPIHRSVSALTLSDVADLCLDRGDELVVMSDREAAFAAQATSAEDPDRTAFVVSDGRAWGLLSTVRTHGIDAAVLHETLFPAWRIAEGQVGYHHNLDQALHTVARQPGVVIAVHPPTVAQVMDSAARGVRMPRKSTSFAPKPRMGVVMRDLRDR